MKIKAFLFLLMSLLVLSVSCGSDDESKQRIQEAETSGGSSEESPVPPQAEEPISRGYTDDFRTDCNYINNGVNPFFNLTPGRVTTFRNEEDEEEVVITVLDETQEITLPDREEPVVTRVVEERETAEGRLVEVSRNFFAICQQTNDVFYFGEDVQIFEEDGTISNEGQWRAGINDARAGIIMPGTFLLGSKYFQEVAPEVALDRAEHTDDNLTEETVVGTFTGCVEVTETTPLERGEKSVKVYCPDVGLVDDDGLRLMQVTNP